MSSAESNVIGNVIGNVMDNVIGDVVTINATNYEARSLMNRRKRQRQLRRYYSIALLIITVIIVTAAILLVSLSAQANEKNSQPSHKYYKSIEIKKGDTLWSIAKDYSDDKYYENTSEYIKEVRSINSLTSDNIIAGSYIIVPYFSDIPMVD